MPEFDCEVHPSILLASTLFRPNTDEERQLIQASLALCAWHEERGDTCVPLAQYQKQQIHIHTSEQHFHWQAPALTEWKQRLLTLPLVNSSDLPAVFMLEEDLLYVHRLYRHEVQLAACLRQRAQLRQDLELVPLLSRLHALFPDHTTSAISWQLIAALNCLSCTLSMISGGPGTGKTSTVAKIISLLLHQSANTPLPRIVLAAPTGKAATRMLESLKQQQGHLFLSETESAAFPTQALTLHRLRQSLTYQSEQTIDCLIIDETSMADISILNSCLQLLPQHCRIILLGDPLQLASVESGSVLIDLCACSQEVFPPTFVQAIQQHFQWNIPSSDTLNGLDGCRVELKHNWRFKDAPGITALSLAVSQGQENLSALSLEHADCSYYQLDQLPNPLADLVHITLPHFLALADCPDPASAIAAMQDCMILCAWKNGPLGVKPCNQQIEQMIRTQQHIHEREQWYHGKPFIVNRNNYDLGIYNGDIGIIWHGQAWIDSGPQLKVLALDDLQDCDPLYAMSIHKSQGSQFKHVHVILPERHLEHANRALYYTALTRAKQQLSIWSTETALKSCCAQEIIRHTDLQRRLLSCLRPRT